MITSLITSATFFLVVLYMLHATCRPNIPIAARASILVAAGGVMYWWLSSRPDDQEESVRQWVAAHWAYVVLGVIVIAVFMVMWAMYLRRREDRQNGAPAE